MGFEFNGINHLALVCEDMDRTVDFYTNVLGMPLTKTIDLPGGVKMDFVLIPPGSFLMGSSQRATRRSLRLATRKPRW